MTTAVHAMVEDGPEPFSHYCDVVRAGDLVWVSGMAAVGPEHEVLAPGDPAEQARIAHGAIGKALETVGAGPADVVKVSNYLTDIGDRLAVNEARREFFGETRPASVICEVPKLVLDGLLYEVEATAVIGGEKQRVMLEGGPEPFHHYCDVVRAGDVVWVTGQAAVGPDNEVLAEGDPLAQARLAFEGLGQALAAVGATPADVVKVSNYLTNIDDRPVVNEARREFFGEHLPASLLYEVPSLVVPGLLYEVEAIAVVGGEKQRVTLEGAPPPFSHYCDVVRAGDLVFVSGQAAVDRDHQVLCPGDAVGQARIALEAVANCLEAVGASVDDIVKVSNYLTRVDDRPAVNVARREFFGEHLPASFLCEVGRLVVPGLLYEVEAVAVVGGGGL
jgi:2-iminobutanoate/2-iminopropanoate deaminase